MALGRKDRGPRAAGPHLYAEDPPLQEPVYFELEDGKTYWYPSTWPLKVTVHMRGRAESNGKPGLVFFLIHSPSFISAVPPWVEPVHKLAKKEWHSFTYKDSRGKRRKVPFELYIAPDGSWAGRWI
ncbi:MAG TPA: hypothetical protein VJU82_07690 [Acidobacteriaceae bacterium]|nr:hypothetical protein [Acidobacteriaceae bacterium]